MRKADGNPVNSVGHSCESLVVSDSLPNVATCNFPVRVWPELLSKTNYRVHNCFMIIPQVTASAVIAFTKHFVYKPCCVPVHTLLWFIRSLARYTRRDFFSVYEGQLFVI